MTLGSNTSGHLFDTTFNTDGVLYSAANGVITSTTVGTAGQVLTSNGAGVAPTFQAASGGSSTCFSVAMNTPASTAQNSLVDIVYDTVLVDTASGYSAGTYTIPTTGNWLFTVVGGFQAAISFINCDIFINKNSGTYLYHGQPFQSVSSAVIVSVNGSAIFPLNAGDTIKISVFAQTTGGTNYDVMGIANGYFNIFSGMLI